ncbi:MAG: LysM peptidoglycan-binding domain-containing protein, partial [Deltaproteobacteria bacterium]|nr:LysM peptidoglycan-binding domain-containing protein [Deltaproteobacteria bacterium]
WTEPYLVSQVQEFTNQPLILFLIAAFLIVFVPMVEEAIKTIGVWPVIRRGFTPYQAFIGGAIAGAGYGLFEAFFLGQPGVTWVPVMIARAGATMMHMITTALTSLGIARARESGRWSDALRYYFVAVFLHSLWNISALGVGVIILIQEDLRFMISKRILEIYASRNIVVNGNHDAIPMVMNKHIQAEMDRFTKKGEKKFFIESYKRSGRYRSQIVSSLKEAGLPVELSWLPLIESGFKVNALSKARALGLWQFIPSTGYKFGLKRTKYINERIDPVKSTKAAIAYLKELHQIFGDWATVLAAYNCGEGRVLRVIRTQNINYLDNFWDLYERLPQETARYVPRFMATLHIVKNLEKYGLDSIPVNKPLEYEIITISKQVHLRNVAKKIGATEKTLRELNPELRYRILPQDKYPLRVPIGKGQILLAKLDEIPVSYPPQRAYVYHRIRPGESLSTIARRYRCSVSRIMRANNLRRSSFIVAGKKLKIPRKGTIVYRPKKQNRTDYVRPSTHVVKSGDSLWIIAKRYGTTTKKIQDLNSLPTTHLHVGQVLEIPGSKYEKQAGKDLKIYLVSQECYIETG